MDDPSDNNYDSFADVYDAWHDRWPANSKAHCVDALAKLADGQAALELAVGTGRVALPLSMQGLRVSGVDNSIKMIEKLRAKPGAERLSIVCGNYANVPLAGPFGLIYVLLSFGYLLTQAEQLRCFVNVSRKLTENGTFVIQTAMPGRTLFKRSSHIDTFDIPSAAGVDLDSVMLVCSKTDMVRQAITQKVIVLGASGPKIYTHRLRYVWPSELDLMAQIAGLQLHARWDNWRQEPFTSKSPTNISVYKRAR